MSNDHLHNGTSAVHRDTSGVTAFHDKDHREDTHNHPLDPLLRPGRIPHIWCPGCGIGTTVNCFARALTESGLDLDQTAIVSGIGCTGRVAGYMDLDSFHTTHGRAIPFAVMERASVVGILLVVFIAAIGLSNDISSLSNGSLNIHH